MAPNRVSVPSDRLVHQFASPGFATSIPKAANFELVPVSLQGAMHELWGATWQPSQINFYSLRDVFVIGEGLVFDQNLNLIDISETQNSQETIAEAFNQLQASIAKRDFLVAPGTMLLCGKAGLNNYGHWLAEMLPKIQLSKPWISGANGWKVLVPKVYENMRQVVTDSLSLAGIGDDQSITSDGGPILVDELVLVDGLSNHGRFFSPLVVTALDELTANILPADHKAIWVTRQGDARSLLSEDEVNRRLSDLGWTIMIPGSLTLREQIALARGATHMAGVNGAGLSNLLFMRPGGRVTSFIPAVMPDVFYWQLSGHRGLTYEEVRSAHLPDFDGPVPWNSRLTLSADEVVTSLTQKIA